jgi:hypothetical protein
VKGVCRYLAATSGVLCVALAGCVSSAPAVKPSAVNDMPRLEVIIGCGDCEVMDGVALLIRSGYADALARSGAREMAGRTATLTIKTYSQRGVGTRFLVGPLGIFFSDAMQAELVFDGRKMQVSESARVPFQGMETVARRLGEKALESLQQ